VSEKGNRTRTYFTGVHHPRFGYPVRLVVRNDERRNEREDVFDAPGSWLETARKAVLRKFRDARGLVIP
jgi:hypothetical protein